MSRARFFPADEAELRSKLGRYLSKLGKRLNGQPFIGQVRWLLLAGGYGRGEGGVWRAAPGAAPCLYNDLELYLVLNNRRARAAAAVWTAAEAHRGEEETGIEIEFKLLTFDELNGAGPSMFYYDLLAAHELVAGDATTLRDLPAVLTDETRIPAVEATRLLFNRGTGLWFCRQALDENSERVTNGFIERNHAKARLALADAVLAFNGRYHFSALVRQERLAAPMAQEPPNWPRLVAWHSEAVEFKFHPRHEHPAAELLLQRQEELEVAWSDTFLWLESARLGRPFVRAGDYAEYPGRLFPASPVWRNGLLHIRDRWRRGLRLGGWRDYPRAALQRVLLLRLGGAAAADERARDAAARLLGLPAGASDDSSIAAAYRRGWQFYN